MADLISCTLIKILDENRLNGHNYRNWKINLSILLTAEKLIHVLNENVPTVPAEDATQDVVDTYKLWHEHDSLAKCYILAFLEKRLQEQHETFLTAREIMDSLKAMFEHHNRSARQAAMKGLMSTKMAEGSSVYDHVTKMIGFIYELDSLGSVIDIDTKIDVILSSLPDSFNQFVLNFNMNNMVVTLPKLCNMLQTAEDVIREGKPDVMVAEGGKSYKPKFKNEKRKKDPKQIQGDTAKRVKKDQSDDVCYFCGNQGHWKRNCHEYRASLI